MNKLVAAPRESPHRDGNYLSSPNEGLNISGTFFTAALRTVQQFSLIIAMLVCWEVGVRIGWINGNLFPPPSQVMRAIVDLAQLGLLWRDTQASVIRVLVGFTIASIVAIGLAALLGRAPRLAFYFLPIVEIIRPISVIAWIPIAILWFGIGDKPAWFLIFLGAFFPIFTNTYLGIRAVQPIHVQAAQSLGAGKWLFARKVLFPSALPYVLAGMRVGLGVGWMCVIAAELIAASSGLGYMIQLARVLIETEKILAGMLIIGLIGFAMNFSMLLLEKKLTPWSQHAD